MMNIKKKRFILFFRFVTGLLILYIALIHVQWDQVLEIAKNIDFIPLLIGYIIFIVIAFITAFRFKIIVSEPSRQIPFSFALHLTFVSAFFNIVIPANSGGDAIRLWHTRKIIPLTRLILSVFIDRIIGLTMLYIIATLGLILFAPILPKIFLEIYIFFSCMILLLISSLIFPLIGRFFHKIIKKVKIFNFINDLINRIMWTDFNIIKNYKDRIIKIVPLVLITHTLIITIYWFISLSLEINIKIVDLFWIIPVLNIVLMIPLSVSDIGVREGVLAYLLGFVDIGYSEAIALALLYRVVHISYIFLTGIAWMKKIKHPSREVKCSLQNT